MITEDRVMKSLTYLAETDERAANARALVVGLEHGLKTAKAMAFMEMTGTMAEREAGAYDSPEYRAAVDKLQNAVADYELYRNKRKTEELIVEVWRSTNANRRRGNM